MKSRPVKSIIIAAAVVLIADSLALSIPAYALADLSANQATQNSQTTASSKLGQAKLKLCAAHENAINGILARIANRGSRHLALITSVATRTENFYKKNGKPLSNYDSLVANVNTTMTAAQSAVNLVKTTSTSFSCSSSDPLGALQQFKDNTLGEVAALQAYKTAVQNLVSGVKTVANTSTEASGGNQ